MKLLSTKEKMGHFVALRRYLARANLSHPGRAPMTGTSGRTI